MAKKTKVQKIFQKIRNQNYEDTKKMTTEEKLNYYSKGAELGKKRIKAVAAEKKKAARENQVLIRLTAPERQRLEHDARQEKTTLSSLIRSRALCENSPLDIVIQHLEKIESRLVGRK